MSKFKKPQSILIFYGSFVAIVAALIIGNMLLSPSESGSALALRLSAPRLAMAIGLLAAFILFSLLILRALRDSIWAESFLDQWLGEGIVSQRVLWLSWISFTLSWI